LSAFVTLQFNPNAFNEKPEIAMSENTRSTTTSSDSSVSRIDSSYMQTIAIMQSSLSFQPLISRQSTFWPSAQELMQRHPSFEFLNPEHDSDLRKSSPLSSVMNLVATVCGGGVLTLPIAFAKAGIIPSTVLMIFSAIMTDFAMYILCSCARRTGGKSYGDVTRIAFGAKAEIGVTILLAVFLCCVMVAFMVLVKDIWTPLIIYAIPALKTYSLDKWHVDPDVSSLPSDVFLVVFIVLSLPLLFQKDLHALRHTCYVGFASLLLLIVAICGRTYELNFVTDVGSFQKKVKWMTYDINDIIYAFPIISLSFFSIYNVLSVHSSLVNPTRYRVKFVLDSTIGICLV
jgi:amino acid permease